MPGFAAGVALLLLNLGIIAAVLVFSSTPRQAGLGPPAPDQCFVCSATDPDRTVRDYPVCDACETEYFRTVQ